MDFTTLNLLFRCSKEYSHEKIHLKDLSDTECMICSFIYAHPDCSQENVATALKADKTTVAKALAALEGKSCVQRTRDETDRRKMRLRLTETGYDRVAGLIDIHNEWLSAVLSCLSPEEQAQFENYCERLLSQAESLADKRENGGEHHAQE